MEDAAKQPAARRGATFDETGAYRYHLWRAWDDALPRVCFVMLNPSVADADRDDPTIRRCMGFAKTWGFGALDVVNLYAFRATRPADLFRAADPFGPDNDQWILEMASRAALVIAAWGNHGAWRSATVLPSLGAAYCLGMTAAGQPRHPLYVRRDRKVTPCA